MIRKQFKMFVVSHFYAIDIISVFRRVKNAGVVKLADTPDLGSGAKACRFKSCYPYQLQTAQQCGLFDFYDILAVDKTVTVYRS